jgi:hypothetical protein
MVFRMVKALGLIPRETTSTSVNTKTACLMAEELGHSPRDSSWSVNSRKAWRGKELTTTKMVMSRVLGQRVFRILLTNVSHL